MRRVKASNSSKNQIRNHRYTTLNQEEEKSSVNPSSFLNNKRKNMFGQIVECNDEDEDNLLIKGRRVP